MGNNNSPDARLGRYLLALKESTVIYSLAEVNDVINSLAAKVSHALEGKNPIIMPIMNGGIYVYTKISEQLTYRKSPHYEFDYIHASRYGNERHGTALISISDPHVDVSGRTILLLDDIFDLGYTLEGVQNSLYDLGAKEVLTAVLCTKTRKRNSDIPVPDFSGCEVPDKFVFGCGMDYQGYGRNIRCIRAEKR